MKPPIALEQRDEKDGRLYSPSAGRNREIIGQVLSEHLPRGARVLEIASGTGEHGAHMCGLRPDIIWQCSDIDTVSRASQNAWAQDHAGQMLPSLPLDATSNVWWKLVPDIDTFFCANMIHIAPWEAFLGLAQGAEHLLTKGQNFILYGPFFEGEDTAPSNLAFDLNLKSRNPAWGVRKLDSVKHILTEHGFTLSARIVMPKENRTLIFSKSQ